LSEPLHLDRLRAAFAQPGEAPAAAACPGDEAIWDAVHGALPPDLLRELVDHLAACPACAESWRIAMQFERSGAEIAAASEEASASAVHSRPAAGTGHRTRSWLYGGAAAAAALAAAVLLHHDAGHRATPAGGTLRGGGTTAGQLSAVRWLTESEAVLARRDAVLHWAGPPATIYDLTVERGEAPAVPGSGVAGPLPPLAAASGLTATSYRLAAADLAPAPAGSLVRATLTAHLPDGSSVMIFRDFRVR
jgi:hypothetical protein